MSEDDEIDEEEEEVSSKEKETKVDGVFFFCGLFFLALLDIVVRRAVQKAAFSRRPLGTLQVEASPPPRPVIPTLQPDPSIRCLCGSQLDNQVGASPLCSRLAPLAAVAAVCLRAFFSPWSSGFFFFVFFFASCCWFW